jgi:hypothetical protein
MCSPLCAKGAYCLITETVRMDWRAVQVTERGPGPERVGRRCAVGCIEPLLIENIDIFSKLHVIALCFLKSGLQF